jgi:glyoxylase-like metal-dependent hydrolase (beta-lactamase superfamily II)
MKILTVSVGPLGTNCYIVSDENKNCVLIDPGFEAWKIEGVLQENALNPTHILLTHGHYDHFAAVKKLNEQYNCKVVIHEDDALLLENADLSLLSWFEALTDKTITPDIIVKDGDDLKIGSLNFSFLHTPGHTDGSVCIFLESNIFTGDTLFYESIGRSDLPGGNNKKLMLSLKKLLSLKDDYTLYPGHMQSTTLFSERQHNTYLRGL